MQLSYIIDALETLAPPALAEDWDNSGLQIGLPPGLSECTGAVICLDVTEGVLDEASQKGANLVISHHPLIFKGLKSLTGSTPAQALAAEAIRRGIAVYSAHTNLDSAPDGVSARMARIIGAKVLKPLCPSALKMSDIRVTCSDPEAAILSLYDAGAVDIDFVKAQSTHIEESFRNSVPEFEVQNHPIFVINAKVEAFSLSEALIRLKADPKVISVEARTRSQSTPAAGLGVVAQFDRPISKDEFIARLAALSPGGYARASEAFQNLESVGTVALCGGAGGEFIARARAAAQVYVSGDIRYHDFRDFGAAFPIVDIGHFESEYCTKQIFYDYLSEKFANFALYIAQADSNPVKYIKLQ